MTLCVKGKYVFTANGLNYDIENFRDLLQFIHAHYYVALVRIDNNNQVYLNDLRVGKINCIPHDYKG